MPPYILSSAIGKTVLESIKNISLVHMFPFPNPLNTESSSDAARRGLVPSLQRNCEYLVTFSTTTSAPWELQLIFLSSVHKDKAVMLCYSYIVKLEVLPPYPFFK